jgi:hypothetical protein
VFPRLSRAQQADAVADMKALYKICVDVGGGENAATTFVARFIHRSLMALDHQSQPITRHPSPSAFDLTMAMPMPEEIPPALDFDLVRNLYTPTANRRMAFST